MIDTQRARRAIAGLLMATGAPAPAELALANERLRALGWPPLGAGDLVRETPETLAPQIELAGDEPIRRRIADAYAQLWHGEPEPPAPPRQGSAVARWLIGQLPHHQVGGTSEENRMVERGTPYRGGEVAAPPQAERTPLRRRVERINDEYRRVVGAVERVIVGKRDVIERVLTAMAARGHVLLVDAPGVGKTQLCKAIACAIATRFGRIQFTPDLLPMDITGANVFDVRDKQFHFRPGAQDPVGAARGDGGAQRHDRRRHPRRRGAVPGPGDDEPARPPGHLRAAGGPDRPLHDDARDRLSVARRRGQGPRLSPRRHLAAGHAAAGDLARLVHRLARDGAADPRRAGDQAHRGRLRPRAAPQQRRPVDQPARHAGVGPRRAGACDAVGPRVRHRRGPAADRAGRAAPPDVERRRGGARAAARDRDVGSPVMPSPRELRIATLVAAPLVATIAAASLHQARILQSTVPALGILWLVAAAALIGRAIHETRRRDRRPDDFRPGWDHLDVLTATGGAVMWTSAAAIVASGVTGWASLAVLGVFGLGIVFLAVAWTALAAAGDAPWCRARITRAIVPASCIEGDRLREQVHIADVRIPAGMRLFAAGRVHPDSPVTRYAVGSEGSRAELRLDSELGPALRGEHVAPPLAFWLGDVLGLTRSQSVEYGETRFSVLPRPAPVDGVRALLGAGGDDAC
ncbi:MAG: hypothetical protein E6J91_36585, partial [Deltaproteobacteria bacterium]